LERLGWEGENPQKVVVPNDDDDDNTKISDKSIEVHFECFSLHGRAIFIYNHVCSNATPQEEDETRQACF
jgi:hypothetical protein